MITVVNTGVTGVTTGPTGVTIGVISLKTKKCKNSRKWGENSGFTIKSSIKSSKNPCK